VNYIALFQCSVKASLVYKESHKTGTQNGIYSNISCSSYQWKNAICKYNDLCNYQIVQLFFLENGTWVVDCFVGSEQIYLLSIVFLCYYCDGLHTEIHSYRYFRFIWGRFFGNSLLLNNV
jgi:hypothetical protein